MATTTQTLGLGRDIYKRVWAIESAKVPAQFNDVLSSVDDTTQTYEIYKQLAGLTYADQTDEGETIKYDDWQVLFTKNVKPVKFTKGLRFSVETDYTNQYKQVLDKQPALVRAFMHQRNRVAANLDNLGFTDTTMGMNSETLYSTSHNMGAGNATGSNRPAVELALSPLAIEQGLTELRKQKSARGTPMPILGKVLLKVPPALEFAAKRYVRSQQLAGTNNNDPNVMRDRLDVAVIDYYTSDTAWFLRAMGAEESHLHMLKGIPYTVEKLALTDNLMNTWAAYETYTCFWADWHGSWGTVGA